MDINNILRTESHIAQKLRRHKLRFHQNSDDPTHQHPPQDPRFGSGSYDPIMFPSEMLNSIAVLPPHNHGFVDQDSCSGSGSGSGNPQTGQNQLQVSNDWSVVSFSNVGSMGVDQRYHQDPYYHNGLQEIFTSATHVNQLGFIANRSDNNNNINNNHHHSTNESNHITQGLSLSLSSVPQGKPEFTHLHSGPKALKIEHLTNSDPKQKMGMGSFAHRSVGPLGPFTGYATILKNSKYLEPAQELLSGSCDVGGHDQVVQTCDNGHKILDEEMSRVSGDCGASSSAIYGSNEHIADRSSSLSESYRPEFHHKKAKLLYMQEEVCRKYKQYHQQMQMVISSFETVAGLTSSTPYVSLALKSVSRHFHFVKNAISDQLIQMKKTFEDLCSPSKTYDANNTTDSLRSMDHNFHGKSSGGTSFFGNQPPVWRPQRGLPERAVSVLKAWLFDHFLHPSVKFTVMFQSYIFNLNSRYPSDADKHMLATQTGLTRNQVSNWFINARVRIWKPMVEEIHTLETKALADSSPNKPLADGQDTSRVDMGSTTNKLQPERSRTSGALTTINGQNEPNEQLWDHEKRSRSDYNQMSQTTMDQPFSNMMPYPRTTFETGGVGPVSLTLGLWQNAEHVQQLQQQHEHQFRQHFGGQLIHDFVG